MQKKYAAEKTVMEPIGTDERKATVTKNVAASPSTTPTTLAMEPKTTRSQRDNGFAADLQLLDTEGSGLAEVIPDLDTELPCDAFDNGKSGCVHQLAGSGEESVRSVAATPNHDVLDDAVRIPGMLIGDLIPKRSIQARRLEIECLQVEDRTSPGKRPRLELLDQASAQSLPPVCRLDPELLQLAAGAPGPAHGAANDSAVRSPGEAGDRLDLTERRCGLIGHAQSFVDDRRLRGQIVMRSNLEVRSAGHLRPHQVRPAHFRQRAALRPSATGAAVPLRTRVSGESPARRRS